MNSSNGSGDLVERASCGHLVQSNGTCGLWGCSNYGKK